MSAYERMRAENNANLWRENQIQQNDEDLQYRH